MTIPIILDMVELNIADATSPLEDFVMTITALIAMGKQPHIIIPWQIYILDSICNCVYKNWHITVVQ